ncbi:MAG: hypothetical protein AB1515_03340, partial [Nitrospirota bacterium]
MRRQPPIAAAVLLLCCVGAVDARAAENAPRADAAAEPGLQTASTVEELALVLSTLFPAITGAVMAVDGDRLEVDVGTAQGARPALALSVYRPGEPFRHPLTGAPMASSETMLGAAIVERVEPGRAAARLLEPPAQAVRAGDRVRLTAARLPVALASSTSPAVAGRLVAALEETGRFLAKPLVSAHAAPALIGAVLDPAGVEPDSRWAP